MSKHNRDRRQSLQHLLMKCRDMAPPEIKANSDYLTTRSQLVEQSSRLKRTPPAKAAYTVVYRSGKQYKVEGLLYIDNIGDDKKVWAVMFEQCLAVGTGQFTLLDPGGYVEDKTGRVVYGCRPVPNAPDGSSESNLYSPHPWNQFTDYSSQEVKELLVQCECYRCGIMLLSLRSNIKKIQEMTNQSGPDTLIVCKPCLEDIQRERKEPMEQQQLPPDLEADASLLKVFRRDAAARN